MLKQRLLEGWGLTGLNQSRPLAIVLLLLSSLSPEKQTEMFHALRAPSNLLFQVFNQKTGLDSSLASVALSDLSCPTEILWGRMVCVVQGDQTHGSHRLLCPGGYSLALGTELLSACCDQTTA